jgi:hypothetical protein
VGDPFRVLGGLAPYVGRGLTRRLGAVRSFLRSVLSDVAARAARIPGYAHTGSSSVNAGGAICMMAPGRRLGQVPERGSTRPMAHSRVVRRYGT